MAKDRNKKIAGEIAIGMEGIQAFDTIKCSSPYTKDCPLPVIVILISIAEEGLAITAVCEVHIGMLQIYGAIFGKGVPDGVGK